MNVGFCGVNDPTARPKRVHRNLDIAREKMNFKKKRHQDSQQGYRQCRALKGNVLHIKIFVYLFRDTKLSILNGKQTVEYFMNT